MSVERSIEAAGAIEPFDIYWFEEPIVPDVQRDNQDESPIIQIDALYR